MVTVLTVVAIICPSGEHRALPRLLTPPTRARGRPRSESRCRRSRRGAGGWDPNVPPRPAWQARTCPFPATPGFARGRVPGGRNCPALAPRHRHPALTEVRGGRRSHFRRRPGCRGPGGPRAAPPGFRPRRRPTWWRAGSGARKPPLPRRPAPPRPPPGPALPPERPASDVGPVRGARFTEEEIETQRGGRLPPAELSSELGVCTPPPPYTCTLLPFTCRPNPSSLL